MERMGLQAIVSAPVSLQPLHLGAELFAPPNGEWPAGSKSYQPATFQRDRDARYFPQSPLKQSCFTSMFLHTSAPALPEMTAQQRPTPAAATATAELPCFINPQL